jgi:hypothetical protein
MVNELNGKPYAKKVIISGQVFPAANISDPARSSGELQPFLR